jgi:hypothetical protein
MQNSPTGRRHKAEQLFQCNPNFRNLVLALSSLQTDTLDDSEKLAAFELARDLAERKLGKKPATAAWGVRTLKTSGTEQARQNLARIVKIIENDRRATVSVLLPDIERTLKLLE